MSYYNIYIVTINSEKLCLKCYIYSCLHNIILYTPSATSIHSGTVLEFALERQSRMSVETAQDQVPISCTTRTETALAYVEALTWQIHVVSASIRIVSEESWNTETVLVNALEVHYWMFVMSVMVELLTRRQIAHSMRVVCAEVTIRHVLAVMVLLGVGGKLTGVETAEGTTVDAFKSAILFQTEALELEALV